MVIVRWIDGFDDDAPRRCFGWGFDADRHFEDAAVLDGCGGLAFLWHVLFPLARPTLVAFALISLVSHWNDYLWPLIVTDTPDVRSWPRAKASMTATRAPVSESKSRSSGVAPPGVWAQVFVPTMPRVRSSPPSAPSPVPE